MTKIKLRLLSASLFGCLALAVFSTNAVAQKAATYPDHPVRVVNPSSAGGNADVISRIVMQEMTKNLGQNFVIDNKPGAANIIATDIVAKAPPDGYTLLIATTGSFVTNPLLYTKLPYAQKDFETISIVADAPFILSVHPSVQAKNLDELVALARAQPNKLTYASFGNGSSTHLAGELFQSMTNTKLIHVPYKGSAPGMADLIAGHISMGFDTATTSIPNIQAGRIRPIGVASPTRLPSLPDVPTMAELGLKDYYVGSWYAVMAPAGTPKDIVAKLHGNIIKALQNPDVNKRIRDLGTQVIGNTPEEFSAQITREREHWAPVVKTMGIKLD